MTTRASIRAQNHDHGSATRDPPGEASQGCASSNVAHVRSRCGRGQTERDIKSADTRVGAGGRTAASVIDGSAVLLPGEAEACEDNNGQVAQAATVAQVPTSRIRPCMRRGWQSGKRSEGWRQDELWKDRPGV